MKRPNHHRPTIVARTRARIVAPSNWKWKSMFACFASRPRLALVCCTVGFFGVNSIPASEPSRPPIAALIDEQIDRQIDRAGVTPAGLADDATLLRRTMLDLVGRIPTAAEARAYVDSRAVNKRTELVDRLIASPGFARHQARAFDGFLMDDTSASLEDYLRAAFLEGRPWDEMFRDMLAVGRAAPSPAEAYVRARVKDLDRLTNDASVMFFGVNVSCAKCHDHPLVPEWSQAHFYGMKSFFCRSFEHGEFVGEREYGRVKYKTTEGEELPAQMMFLTGTVIEEPPSAEPTDAQRKAEKKRLEALKKDKQPPPIPQFSRRQQLAHVALQPEENQYFARAIVNRLWFQFIGHGFVMPLDQMHPENEASHPELLQALAEDLVGNGYDLRRLMRGIVLSDTYARTSRWEEGPRPAPELFAVANVRPLGPFQYASSLFLAGAAPAEFSGHLSDADLAARVDSVLQRADSLAARFARPRAGFQVSVAEALMLNNSQDVATDLLAGGADSLVGYLESRNDNQELIQTAFWNVLVRKPDEAERKRFNEYLRAHSNRGTACRQLVWALLASSELRFNY